MNNQNTDEILLEQANRISRTKFYKEIGLFILISMFIFGIILGNKEKTEVLTYESSISPAYDEYEEEFNSALMYTCWSIGLGLYTIFQITNSICYRLDLIIDKQQIK